MIKTIISEILLAVFISFVIASNNPKEKIYENNPLYYNEVEQLVYEDLSYELINSNYKKLGDKNYKITYNPGATKVEKDGLKLLIFPNNSKSDDNDPKYPIFKYEINIYGNIEDHFLLYSDYGHAITIEYENEAYSNEPLVYDTLLQLYTDLKNND